jgi:hypothetical protein
MATLFDVTWAGGHPRIIRSFSGEASLCRVDRDNFHEILE